jgi:hypothetical protein
MSKTVVVIQTKQSTAPIGTTRERSIYLPVLGHLAAGAEANGDFSSSLLVSIE